MNGQDFRDKYRPRSFADFVGNKRPIEILRDIVKSRRIPNGVLFHGPAGTGKTSLELVLAKALSCQNFSEDVCGRCVNCLAFEEFYENSDDLWILHDCTKLNEKSFDEIFRKGFFAGASLEMAYDIHIFDELDRAKDSLQSRLLSHLEMKKNSLLIFSLIDLKKIDEAFRQRVTVLKTSRPEIEELIPWIGRICELEGIIVKGEDALRQLALAADRLPRVCLSFLQTLSYLDKSLTTSLVREIAQDNKGHEDGGSRYRIL
jgi:DNA polymerase III delta prime subunit